MNTSVRKYIEKNFQTWQLPIGYEIKTNPESIIPMLENQPEGFTLTLKNISEALLKYGGEEGIQEQILLNLWNTLEQKLQNHEISRLMQNQIGFGACDFRDVNAFAFPFDENMHGVCVTLHLPIYILSMTWMICAHLKLGPYKTQLIKDQDFYRYIATVTLGFIGQLEREKDWDEYNLLIDYRNWVPTLEHADAIFSLQNSQLVFVLCHELAHIISGHTNEKQLVSKVFNYSMHKVLTDFSDTQVYSRIKQQEFEADLEGIHLMISSYGKQSFEMILASYCGINILFSIMHYFEAMLKVLYGENSLTHPPAVERRRRIKNWFEKTYKIDQRLCKSQDFIFDIIDGYAREVRRVEK